MELGRQEEVIMQGNVPQEAWRELVEKAIGMGAVAKSIVVPEADMPSKEPLPTHLSQQDFLRVAGDNEKKLATRAWMATLLLRENGIFQFASDQPGIQQGGLIALPFAQKVRATQADLAGKNENEVKNILKKAFVRGIFKHPVTPKIFSIWVDVLDSYAPLQNTEQQGKHQ